MANYQEIYNDVVTHDVRYSLAENSPGFRAVVQETDRLSVISGRSLDVGCGVGFVLEYLTGPTFNLRPFGVDVSNLAVDKAKQRLTKKLKNPDDQIRVSACQSLPFDDDFFGLVTCFDVLEHLDEEHIDESLNEITRVIRPGGIFLGSVSCRRSGVTDIFGDNLHRTVRSVDWWIERTNPDQAIYDGHRKQLLIWKRAATGTDAAPMFGNLIEQKSSPTIAPAKVQPGHPANSKALYQRIYDDNPWYGDAEEGRCPGVRLLPLYRDWLIGPVIDLGCGRGQTVEHLRQEGFEAEGIDQIEKNPEMMVGDITKPIEGLSRFNSAVCVDCIEHLYDNQVQGLFANMKQVRRQAFSIHNGESTGTGQELHVNRRPFHEWRILIEANFEIADEIELHENQMLYLTESR
jgi:SAM-dependent methyltransferase